MTRPTRPGYDLIVVGAGIVGLATAREFLRRHPGMRVLVVDKEATIAAHQTGHNSGVIHSGIYYAPGSLKARTCVEGHRRMLGYCAERGIPVERFGKVIVALDASELTRLDDLHQRGLANGVQGLELIGPERLREIEPFAAGIRAIWSPTTAVVDYKRVAAAYAADVAAAGGELALDCEVRAITPGTGTTVLALRGSPLPGWEATVQARFLVTCGGLQSDRLVSMTQRDNDVSIVPFRGDYYLLKPERRHMVRGLIYPVPDPGFPFLGVHFTRLMSGEVKAGPNAVLAFAREGYRRHDVNLRELGEVLAQPGFWKLISRHWRMGAMEMFRDFVKSAYARELRRYLPALTADDLLPGPSGVRAQALARDGRLVDDFLIRRGERVVHVQNAPSPAATASLVIAETIVNEAAASFGLS